MVQRATAPMVLALAITALGFATLVFAQGVTSPPLAYGGAYAGMMMLLYFGVRLWLPHSDILLLPVVTLLTGLGLIMIFRLTYNAEDIENLATTQVVWILVGSAAMAFIVLFFKNYHRLFEYKYLLAILSLTLIASTILFGYEVNGAKLWLRIGPVNFQPSEFARIALIIFFAGYLADKRELLAATSRSFMGIQIPPLKYFGPVAFIWAASIGLLVFERDLGSSLLFFGVPILMLYVATGRIAYVIIGGLLFLAGAVGTYFTFGYVQERLQTWVNPWAEPDGSGFQILQSLFVMAEGGLTGTGLGDSFARTIPAAYTDFVFSAVAGELGLLGAGAVILVFLVYVYRGMKVSLASRDDASKLLAFGLTAMFAIQTLIIIGGVTKALPLTGITLPFVSYGGSSVVGSFIITGLLLVISERAGKESERV